MIPLTLEFHLLLTLGLNAAVWWCSFRFVRRFREGDRFSCAVDALLLAFAVQYVSVTLPGLIGLLNAWSMIAVAVVACIALFSLAPVRGGEGRGEGRTVRHPTGSRSESESPLTLTPCPGYGGEGTVCVAMLWLVLGYLGCLIYFQSTAPPLGDDGMIYHMPAAVQWLKTGWIGIYHTWFVNPANTYSPLAGSTFMAFLIGTMHNDIAVRFCQMPALLLIFFAMIELLRGLGVRLGVASVIAAAAVICRPFISQAFLVKDDLYLAAFFVAFVAGCSRERLPDRFGPWRLGMSLGLMLAIKYTALFALPLLLLLCDAPIRAKWNLRRWAIFLSAVTLLALPWFIRNWVVTGNPLFPIPVAFGGLTIFDGLFAIAKSTEMSSFHGVWEAFTKKYHELSPVTLLLLLAVWLVAVGMNAKLLLRDPLKRVCLLGSLLGMLIFAFASHAAEIRYTYASLLLLFASMGLIWDWRAQLSLGVILLVISLRTVWAAEDMDYLLAGISIAVAALAGGLWIITRRFGLRPIELFGVCVCLFFAWAIYVHWTAFNISSDKSTREFWTDRYGKQGELWQWTRDELPQDARVAAANVVLPYPLYGRNFRRTVEYIPTRKGLLAYHDLPRGTEKLTDQQIRPWVAQQLSLDPDWNHWMGELKARGMQYLYVEKQVANASPIEIGFAESHPERFRKIFENEAGAIYEIIP